jgi:parallel beta-helix repeat protein
MRTSTEKGGITLRKAYLMIFVVLSFSLMSSLTGRRMSAMASPGVIYVPTDFPTIQAAINSAIPGDTIFVHNGTYNEDIFLNKSISLVGENREEVRIYSVLARYVIEITANGASVYNFTVRNSVSAGNGIDILSVSNITISGDIIKDGYDGLVCYGLSLNDYISNNIFLNNSDSGVSLYLSSGNAFAGNNISNNGVGANLYSSSNNVFSGNTVAYNGLGVSLHDSNDNVFYHNNFINTVQVSSDSNDTWSYNGEGNYWSSYGGVDTKGDGIGGIPYRIATNNLDQYPLVGFFNGFEAVSRNATFEVFVESNTTVSGFGYEVGQQTGNRIIHFDVTEENGSTGFCRLMIPTGLMNLPYIVLDGEGETASKLLSATNETNAYLYLTYPSANQTITVISSEALQLYKQLSKELSDNQATLSEYLGSLNATYLGLLTNYTKLQELFGQLQNSTQALNDSYQQQVSAYQENMRNVQNLIYIFAATTVIFLMTTVYLSRRSHSRLGRKEETDI